MTDAEIWQNTKLKLSDVNVKCPFFHGFKGRKNVLWSFAAVCEGINDETLIQLHFETLTGLKLHMNIYCNDITGCKGCPIYKMINAKYEKESPG